MKKHQFYREWIASDLFKCEILEGETDIFFSSIKNLKSEAKKAICKYRADIIDYMKTHPEFQTSLKPFPHDELAPPVVKAMLRATSLAGVGPMASVAGAISEFVGRELLAFTEEVIVENGGDIFIKTKCERKIGIYAGNSPLSGKIAVKIKPELTPFGICTSSATVGHSLSFGNADAATVIAGDASLADACATAMCNRIRTEYDINSALNFAKSIEGIIGAVVIYKRKIGVKGDIELI